MRKIFRLNADGSDDPGFAPIDFADSTLGELELQSDGRIVASFPTTTGVRVSRFNTNGSRDATFGNAGYAAGLSPAVAIQRDGKILLGGNIGTLGAIRRLNPDGSLDTTFGVGGQVTTDFGGTAVIVDLKLQNDGKIVAGVNDGNQFPGNIIVARYLNESSRAPFDYDGDGKTDISVYRPGEVTWHILQSSSGVRVQQWWGFVNEAIAPADYDGDGKTDVASVGEVQPIFGLDRNIPKTWAIFNSATNTASYFEWGIDGDLLVPADYNGDARADIAVYRPSEGKWHRKDSDGQIHIYSWGIAGDKPAPADFNGDGAADITVFRPSEGKWYTINSGNGSISINQWGLNGDIPIPADYSGDGKADFCVFRPSNQTWYRRDSDTNQIHVITWGLPGDLPVPGDYDGDGRSDLAVFRPSNATWFLNTSTSGIYSQPFGLTGDKPTPNAFVY